MCKIKSFIFTKMLIHGIRNQTKRFKEKLQDG